ncbi:MAG: HDOD domain-containing protein [Actinomycetota bacterium]|nr:HDOD domain-containing protein [Actinomycetota bacterium]
MGLDTFLTVVDLAAEKHSASRELLASFEGVDLDRRAISMAISSDDVFSKSVLRLANSPYYRRGREVTSVDYAVALIGEWTIRAFALLDIFREYGALSSGAWNHSSIVAISAFHVSESRGADPSLSYAAGLIHDVGAFVLRAINADRYHDIEKIFAGGLTSESQKEYLDSERSAFGIDHEELGSLILSRFGFPDQMVAAVRGHHLIEEANHPVTRSIIDGERIVHLSQLPFERWSDMHLFPLQYTISDTYSAVKFMTEEASLLFNEYEGSK